MCSKWHQQEVLKRIKRRHNNRSVVPFSLLMLIKMEARVDGKYREAELIAFEVLMRAYLESDIHRAISRQFPRAMPAMTFAKCHTLLLHNLSRVQSSIEFTYVTD